MNLKHIIRDIGYFGVGAAAVLVEAGGKAAKALVRKGAQTLQDNQDTVDDLKRRAQELCSKAKEHFESAPEAPAQEVDAHQLTPEQRAELRRQLDEADQANEADAQPVAPDVIYQAGAPIDARETACENEPQDAPDPDETPAPATTDED